MTRLVALLLAAILPGSAVLGQSLGELAEDAKRKRKKATKVYTEEDLRKRSPAPSPSPSPGALAASTEATGGEGAGSRGEAGEEGAEGGARDAGRGDEAYWRTQTASRLAAIQKAQERIAAIQSRLSALLADLLPVGAADPFRQQTLEAEKAKARKELEEAELALERAEDAFQELEEEARRKGVPSGWVREP